MTATKNTELSEKDEKKEIEILRAKIAELESKMGQEEDTDKYANVKIPLDEYIPVMSLIPFRLNLSTKELGTGNIKRFTKFGEIKNILYKDLVEIMEVHSNFLQAGYFYILNPAVIRQHGLDEVYSKILTKEKIEEILDTSSDNCVNLYKSANKEQQEIIMRLLINRINDNPGSVNLNVIDRISRESGIDIAKKAADSKAVLEAAKE